jgi:hypothetical protein
MSQRIPIYIPTFISDQNYNPNRVLPRLFFFNGMVECEEYYIESGSLTNPGGVKTVTQFPYFDHYNVVTGSFPTTGSRSLLFNNEAPVYGQQPNETLFTEYWSNYVELLYNPKTRLLAASAIIPLADYFDMELNDIVNWRGNYYHLRAINDYNLKTGECKIQLLGPIIADTFGGITPSTTTTTTTTTAAPASVNIHLEEWNESPTAFFDLNVFANSESFFFSGDFTQSVAPNTSDVQMEVAQNSPSQNWGPYLTASATMTITDNGSTIFDNTSTYTSGSATYSVTSSVNFQSGHTYIISASNQPLTTTTTTTTTTAAPSATLDWSYTETDNPNGTMDLYINGFAVESRSSTSNGTITVYVGDTIYVDLEIVTACGSPTYANISVAGNILSDADCANNAGVSLTTSTYTVVSGDIGSTLTVNTFASCDGGCL